MNEDFQKNIEGSLQKIKYKWGLWKELVERPYIQENFYDLIERFNKDEKEINKIISCSIEELNDFIIEDVINHLLTFDDYYHTCWNNLWKIGYDIFVEGWVKELENLKSMIKNK